MNIVKKLLVYFLMFIILESCQSVKENLSMQKKDSVDEFLIKKKNPLVVPPEFSKLPLPENESENNASEIQEEENLDLSKVLKESETLDKNRSSNELEKSISNILNKK